MLSVCFLWHLHQPYYVDPSTQTAIMPWVRLHTVKGYWDMIGLVEEYPDVHVAFNLTPVLVKQIDELARGTVRDEWLEWSRVPAADLTEPQRIHLLENHFKINWDNLVRPYPRYWQLLQKRGTDLRRIDLRKAVRQWTEPEFRDLQVWYNLAWCGYKAVADYPELGELKKKGAGFSEEDKTVVLRVHSEILQKILGKYAKASQRGQIELTTTPFFHPIMPLLYDSDLARRCMPHTPLPPRFSHPEDVRQQLRLAIEQHTSIFGSPPSGLWPSEGSVCPELVPMFQEAGISWFGTDEEILFRSLANDGVSPAQGRERLPLYEGYRVEHDGAAVSAAFRDRTLSDFIGFTASKNQPTLAAEFFMENVRRIAAVANARGALLPIILDGENAWEYFADGGQGFLRGIYETLSREPEIRTRCFGEFFSTHAPTRTLRRLHTGSWIRADFDIWIGDPEENRAWELLGQARRHLAEQGSRVEAAARQKAEWEIYAAEGSDWFWWYGPDFHTDSDHLFDLLFRRHLENAYRALGTKPPDVLKTRIRQLGARMEVTQPKGLLHPEIDGRVTSFFEWYEAGSYEVEKGQSTMYRTDRVLQRIYFGFDLSNLYLRLDLDPKADRNRVRYRIHFIEPAYQVLEFSLSALGYSVAKSADGGIQFDPVVEYDTCKVGDIVEIVVSFATLGVANGQRLAFNVEELRGDVGLGTYPETGSIRVQLPNTDFELENWQV